MKITLDKNIVSVENTYMNDLIKQISEKQSEMFNEEAIKALNQESLNILFNIVSNELKERGIIKTNGIIL